MGILDDAIREHLELKKAHGAPDEEILAKESEAFGPVRHEPAAETVSEHPEPAAEDPYVVHAGDEPVPDPHDHAHPAGADPAWAEDTELFSQPAAPPVEPEHPAEERHPALHDTDEHLRGHEHAPEPVFREPEPAPEPAPEPEPAAGVEEPAAPADEDVLEETPEFLQDAPEHDRLWFEQKPPRDFDFGE